MKISELKHPLHWCAFGFGLGLLPKMPGTYGSLLAIPLYYFLQPFSSWIYLTVLLALIGIGIFICHKTAQDLHIADHPGIVWDEICGCLLTLWLVPPDWRWVLLGFVLFRFFDILKPWPINYIDKHIKNGWGIMLDDLIAAVYAWVICRSIIIFVA